MRNDHKIIMRRLAVCLTVLSAVLAAMPVAAQFSTNEKFVRAVEDEDYYNVKMLFNNGADLNARMSGTPALVIAAESGNLAIVNFMLENDARANVIDRESGETPLMRAAAKGYTVIAKLLLRQDADLDMPDKSGETALIKAARNGHRDMVELLLEAGADYDAEDYTGRTALRYAQETRRRDIERILEEHGAVY